MKGDNNSESRKSTYERVDKVFFSSDVLDYFLSCGNGEGITRESIRSFYKRNEFRLMKKYQDIHLIGVGERVVCQSFMIAWKKWNLLSITKMTL
jgi:hypothetical protein